VQSLTGSSSAAGLVLFVLVLPQLASPLAGLLVDRLRRRPLLIVTNLLTGAAVLALLLVHGSHDVPIIYAVTFVYGAAYIVLSSGGSALVATMVPSGLLSDLNGAIQTIRQGMRVLAPLLGAGLFAWLGGGAVAVLDAVTFAVAAGTLALIHVSQAAPGPLPQLRWGDTMAGLRHVLGTTVLRQLLAAAVLAVLVLGFSEALWFALVDQGMHRPPSFVGVLVAVEGVGGVASALVAPAVISRIGEGLLVGLGLAALGIGAALAVAPPLPLVLLGMVAVGVSLSWLTVGFFTLLQRLTPTDLQGRAAAAAGLVVGLPQTLAIALGAALVAVVDYRILLLGSGAAVVGAAAYVLTRREQRPAALVAAVVASQQDRPC
jgi:MFS family permease